MQKDLNSPATNLDDIVDNAMAGAECERQTAIRLHDYVRDEIRFGFTPYFDAATAERTLKLRVGHCNPQARLMVELFRMAGLKARFQPVTITNAVLRGVIDTPPQLSHVFTEVYVDGDWRRLDSYIVDSPLRAAAIAKLKATGREIGFGCHVSATGTWNGRDNCFSQVATPNMILELHKPVTDIEDFYNSPEYRHRFGPIRYATLLSPARLAAGYVTRYLNAGVERLRRDAPPRPRADN